MPSHYEICNFIKFSSTFLECFWRLNSAVHSCCSEVEKLYRPLMKTPYICNATTSKNDSAVSSTFSSDANGQHPAVKLSTIREEQLKGNPATHTLAVSSAVAYFYFWDIRKQNCMEHLLNLLYHT